MSNVKSMVIIFHYIDAINTITYYELVPRS